MSLFVLRLTIFTNNKQVETEKQLKLFRLYVENYAPFQKAVWVKKKQLNHLVI